MTSQTTSQIISATPAIGIVKTIKKKLLAKVYISIAKSWPRIMHGWGPSAEVEQPKGCAIVTATIVNMNGKAPNNTINAIPNNAHRFDINAPQQSSASRAVASAREWSHRTASQQAEYQQFCAAICTPAHNRARGYRFRSRLAGREKSERAPKSPVIGRLFSNAKKCGRPGGRAARTRTGRGTGWGGRDRSRNRKSFQRSAVLVGGGGRPGPGVAEIDPDVGVALRLPLDEAVAGLGPGQDLLDLVVENELAAVGLDREHRVAFVVAVAHDGEEERLPRPAGADQQAALEQRIVLAVAVAVIGIGPLLDRAPVVDVGHRLDGVVDVAIDADEILQRSRGQHDVARRGRVGWALARVSSAELDPADRCARRLENLSVEGTLVAGRRRARAAERRRRERQRGQ